MDGYILLPKTFTDKGYTLEFVKDIGEWKIYKRYKKNSKFATFELVFSKKSEEFKIGENTIPKKWSYPNNNQFGFFGYECISLKRAEEKYKEITNKKEEKKLDTKIEILKNKEFTLKDLLKKYSNYSYSKIYIYIKELLDKKKIKIVGEKENKKGRSSKIYKTL